MGTRERKERAYFKTIINMHYSGQLTTLMLMLIMMSLSVNASWRKPNQNTGNAGGGRGRDRSSSGGSLSSLDSTDSRKWRPGYSSKDWAMYEQIECLECKGKGVREYPSKGCNALGFFILKPARIVMV